VSDVRDAYVEVLVDLPNGRQFCGRPIPWQKAVALVQQYDDYLAGGAPSATVVPMIEEFLKITGTDKALIEDLTLGEVIDVVNRFFYHRRPARIAAPSTSTTPPPAPASPLPAGT
jgi:hypothetical protein